jgi:Protein of unknown function (DUF3703)
LQHTRTPRPDQNVAARSESLADSFECEMTLGGLALQRRDLFCAQRHFSRAHDLAHEFLPNHIRAHRGLLLIGWMRHSPRELATQLFSIFALLLVGRIVYGSKRSK